MTPAHTDSPLRRSEAANFREGSYVSINDDEEERRQARRRTILRTSSVGGDSAMLEENETLKKCLEIYNGNKLSKDNAWSLSLIDTLSTLLDRHHKSLNNFGVAGSSLEASSKVYSLRVDSIHTDVLRMSAGLNAQKFSEKQVEDDDDDVATGGEGGNDPNDSAAGVEGEDNREKQRAPKAKQKKQRKIVSTITKNKDTINARLDTVPLQDPVFGKLNTTVGSINSSNRLMNNILLTTDCELRLRTTFPIWNSETLPECDYTEECVLNTDDDAELAACDRLFKMSRSDDMQLRAVHGGYVICDTPEPRDDDDKDNDDNMPRRMSFGSDVDDSPPGCDDGGGGMSALAPFHNTNELGMAFDMNAECEPMPVSSQQITMMDVNFEELDDLTAEERTAINNCRGLRKAPVVIEDLRPVDATSVLEYSYRPIDKISQFWAGPSHWKFKKARARSTMFGHRDTGAEGVAGRGINQRGRPAKRAMEKKKSKQLQFGEFHDELFIKLDDKFKSRKANIQKKWDQRKLKLPMDMRLDSNRFLYFTLAPGLPVHIKNDERFCTSATLRGGSVENDTLGGAGAGGAGDVGDDGHCNDGAAADDMHFDEPMNVCEDDNNLNALGINNAESQQPGEVDNAECGDMENLNDTVLEIATDFDGAPSQVTKVIVPFAKRAKVIDMKHLKRSCTALLTKQMKQHVNVVDIPKHPIPKQENYEEGMASFHEIYEHLPDILPKQMAEALSTSIAFYSVLHLANEYDLRLIPEDDLKDFKIRKVTG